MSMAQDKLDHRVAELERLVEILSRGKYLWEKTFDAIVDPVLVVSEHYKIDRANLALAASSGQAVQTIIGKKCYEVFAHRTGPCPRCPMQQSQGKANLDAFSDGREFLAFSYPLPPHPTSPDKHYVVHYQDVTRLKELEEQLIQSEKLGAIGLLAGGVAHEINNPLGGILAFAQLAKKELSAESQIYQDLTEIEHNALACKRIIEDLLAFARPASKLEKKAVSLSKVMEKVLTLVRTQWKDSKIEIKNEMPNHLPSVLGNENRLEQVFLNLLTNACQALNGEGAVRIFAEPLAHEVMIGFEDNGAGIASEHLPKIFDPYFSTKARGQGTGLGLSITYQIIQAHSGKVEVQSKLNSGTLFKVYLPKSIRAVGGNR